MADLTEMVLGVRLRADADAEGALANLRWMIGMDDAERAAPPAPDGHALWSLASARWMLRGGGIATRGHAPALVPASSAGGAAWELFVWTAFVDRDAESARFLDWIGPFVDHDAYMRDKVLGWTFWQGAGEVVPDVLLYDARERRVRQTTVAKARGFRI